MSDRFPYPPRCPLPQGVASDYICRNIKAPETPASLAIREVAENIFASAVSSLHDEVVFLIKKEKTMTIPQSVIASTRAWMIEIQKKEGMPLLAEAYINAPTHRIKVEEKRAYTVEVRVDNEHEIGEAALEAHSSGNGVVDEQISVDVLHDTLEGIPNGSSSDQEKETSNQNKS